MALRVRERWQSYAERSRAMGTRAALTHQLGTSVLGRLGVEIARVFAWPDGAAPSESDAGYLELRVLRATSEWSAEDRARLVRHGGAYLWGVSDLGFAEGWRCAIARRDGQLACVCWLTPTRQYAPTRGERCWLLQRCFTLAEHRGRGDYPRTLRFAVRTLRGEDATTPILIESSVFNAASLRGIEKAGFEAVGWRVQAGTFARYRRG